MDDGSGGINVVWIIFSLAWAVLWIAGQWAAFSKAGQPGWAAIIPIYNLYVWCKMVGRPGWWVILFFIPLVNIVIEILLSINAAQSFDKGAGFGIGLWLLGPIFWPILGFGSATYKGPAAA